jgi:hypothetical protein
MLAPSKSRGRWAQRKASARRDAHDAPPPQAHGSRSVHRVEDGVDLAESCAAESEVVSARCQVFFEINSAWPPREKTVGELPATIPNRFRKRLIDHQGEMPLRARITGPTIFGRLLETGSFMRARSVATTSTRAITVAKLTDRCARVREVDELDLPSDTAIDAGVVVRARSPSRTQLRCLQCSQLPQLLNQRPERLDLTRPECSFPRKPMPCE